MMMIDGLGLVSILRSMIINMVVMKLVGFVFRLCRLHLWVNRKLRNQGLQGPPPSWWWLFGNAAEIRNLRAESTAQHMDHLNHDTAPRLLPFHTKYSPIYGKRFVSWVIGWEPAINVAEPELIQEVLCSPDFTKTGIQNKIMEPVVGKGIIMATGKEWEQQRRLMNHAFHLDKIKGMVSTMNLCAAGLVKDWQQQIDAALDSSYAQIEVHEEFILLTADIITRTAFGNDYPRKREYVQLERELLTLVFKQSVYVLIPGFRYLPTSLNRRIWKINKRIKACLQELIQTRLKQAANGEGLGNDILGLLLQAAQAADSSSSSNRIFRASGSFNVNTELLIDQCKNFFLAGHETTADSVTWATMLLAVHPEWQSRARDEVRQVLDGNTFVSHDMLPKLKTVGSILSETLRLYPPAALVRRKAIKDTYIGNNNNNNSSKKLFFPKDVAADIPILLVHHDTEIWGADALQFNPQRFMDSPPPPPGAYIPFGSGPRICIGKNFALVESKIIMCHLLNNFKWELSPKYKHAPKAQISTYPAHGMPLLVSHCKV